MNPSLAESAVSTIKVAPSGSVQGPANALAHQNTMGVEDTTKTRRPTTANASRHRRTIVDFIRLILADRPNPRMIASKQGPRGQVGGV